MFPLIKRKKSVKYQKVLDKYNWPLHTTINLHVEEQVKKTIT